MATANYTVLVAFTYNGVLRNVGDTITLQDGKGEDLVRQHYLVVDRFLDPDDPADAAAIFAAAAISDIASAQASAASASRDVAKAAAVVAGEAEGETPGP